MSRAEEGVPYPDAQAYFERSSVTWPKEGFEDLFRDDFIMAAGQVSRRKLNRITTGPYQRALLRQGVSKRVDPEDERVPVLQQAMEYAGSVGTMLLDEVAYVNGQTESGMGRAIVIAHNFMDNFYFYSFLMDY